MARTAKDLTKIKLFYMYYKCRKDAQIFDLYLTKYFLQLVIFIESIFNNGSPLTVCFIGCPVDHLKLLLFHQLRLKKLIN